MRRIAALVLVAAVVVLGAPRLTAGRARVPGGTARTPATNTPGTRGVGFGAAAVASSPPKPTGADAAVAALARRWVTALWTRAPGEAAFAGLDRVADSTAPALLAELRSARPWGTDQTLAATVEIDGIYADATDPATVTVTCVVHRSTATGPADEPCAVTVTTTRAADGPLVVTTLR